MIRRSVCAQIDFAGIGEMGKERARVSWNGVVDLAALIVGDRLY